MTTLLDSAFKKIETLPEIEQNIFARFIIDEIENEKKWENSFALSEDLLENMANEALIEFDSKKTSILDLDKL